MSVKTTAVRLLKDLGAEFGCQGDVYLNTEAQMKALAERAKKLKLSASHAYEVVANDVEDAAKTVAKDAKKTVEDAKTAADSSK